MRTKKRIQTLPLLRYSALILCAATSPAQAERFNLTADFSTTQNPNGVWSFNIAGAPSPGPYETGYGVGWGPGEVPGTFFKNSYTGYSHDGRAGDIVTHVPTTGTNSVTWTSPETGTIDISGLAWDVDFYSSRDASWSLTLNGTVIATRTTIVGTFRTDSQASFANNIAPGKQLDRIPVAMGDVVEFVTQKNASSDHGHFMGVDMTIDLDYFHRITAQPISQVGFWGKSISFSVGVAHGVPPLTYQWLKDGVDISGATNATLEMTNLQAADAATYTVTVTDAAQAILTSQPATLIVNPAGVSVEMHAAVKIDGVVGQTYGIQATTELANSNSWVGVANVQLTQPTQIWYDPNSTTEQPQRFYRVVAGPITIP